MTYKETPLSDLRARIAAEVRAELARQKIPQQSAAHRLGVSQPYLSRRLNGHVSFDVDTLHKLADVLGVPVTRFLPGKAA